MRLRLRTPAAAHTRIAAVAATILVGSAGSALAQPYVEVDPERPAAGFIFTPRVAVGFTHDSNPLFAAEGGPTASDTVTSVSPALHLAYRAKHTTVGLGYNGSVVRYRTFEEYDSFDQGARAELRHQASRQVSLYVTNTYTKAPTTEVVDLAGVPFVRTGLRQNQVTAGTILQPTKQLTLSASYGHQWLEFDRPDEERAALLEGGTMHTISVDAAQELSARVKIGGAYSWRHALVGEVQEVFNIQNAEGTIALQLTPTLTLQGGAGFSYLALPTEFGSRLGPAGRVALHKRTSLASYGVTFSHSFVPSFGFGGSHRNSELGVHVRAPLGRRAYAQSTVSWRSSAPVLERELGLTGVALQGVLGYAAQRWLRLEGFYTGAFQDTPVAGGQTVRHRLGMQVVTLRPMRLQ